MKRIKLLSVFTVMTILLTQGVGMAKDKKTKDKEEAKKQVVYEYASFQYYFVISPQIEEMMEGDHVELEVFEMEQRKSREGGDRSNGRVIFNYGQFQKGDYEYTRQRSENLNDPIEALNFLAQRGWELDAVNSSVINNLIMYVYIVKRPKQEEEKKGPDQVKN